MLRPAGKKVKVILGFIIFSVFFIGLFFIWEDRRLEKVCFKNNCFLAELADDQEKIADGLMHRDSLGQDRGMLFIFGRPGIYDFWMKNMLISLDIIWLDENKKVVFIAKNAQPCGESLCQSINPNTKASYVLEINGGLAEKINLGIGDQAAF
jgi:uncharacterized protein